METLDLRTPDSRSPPPDSRRSKKKGVGLTRQFCGSQLAELGVSWYYNWSPFSHINEPKENIFVDFVPMIFSGKHGCDEISLEGSPVVLGFNEPDHSKQSNLTVEEAVLKWKWVCTLAPSVGSPSMAGNPLKKPWLKDFLKQTEDRVDFITYHWYKGISVDKFIDDVTSLICEFGKPVYITEFACQTGASGRCEPEKYSQEEVDAFIAGAVAWLESEPRVLRYAWHSASEGSSCLYEPDGSLSRTGRAYARA